MTPTRYHQYAATMHSPRQRVAQGRCKPGVISLAEPEPLRACSSSGPASPLRALLGASQCYPQLVICIVSPVEQLSHVQSRATRHVTVVSSWPACYQVSRAVCWSNLQHMHCLSGNRLVHQTMEMLIGDQWQSLVSKTDHSIKPSCLLPRLVQVLLWA